MHFLRVCMWESKLSAHKKHAQSQTSRRQNQQPLGCFQSTQSQPRQ